MKSVAERMVLIFFLVGISVSILLFLGNENSYEDARAQNEKIQDISNITSLPSTPTTTTINTPVIKEYKDYSNLYHPEVEVIEEGSFSDDR